MLRFRGSSLLWTTARQAFLEQSSSEISRFAKENPQVTKL